MKKRLIVISVILSLLFATNVSAASWKTYYGLNRGWYEGTKGHTIDEYTDMWTVKVNSIGWGGCWGGYLYKKINVKKHKKYKISFTMKSTKMSKWVFVKIASSKKSKKYAWAKWIDCKKGKTIKIKEKFTAKHSASRIYFGIGGDFKDRMVDKRDKDVKQRYKLAPNEKMDGRLPDDYSADHPTTIKCKKISLKRLGVKKKKKSHSSSSSSGGRIKKIVIYYY